MNETDVTRAKILGVLIRDAREFAGRSPEDCAAVLGIDAAIFASAEDGNHVLSLPDLEVLAIYLRIPISHFWGSQTLSEQRSIDYDNLVALRQRMIGVQLRQSREAQEKSIDDVAEATGIAVAQLESYEAAQQPIPLFHLEQLAEQLGTSVDAYIASQNGPLGRHEQEQKIVRNFSALPDEMQAFVTEPINIAYLQTAKRLSDMNAAKLRSIAESILEITY